MEAPIKYIKETCGKPPSEVDVEIISQYHALGSYPVVTVVWDDYETSYPDEYIAKCMEAYERFTLPEEIHERGRLLAEIHRLMEKVQDAYTGRRKS